MRKSTAAITPERLSKTEQMMVAQIRRVYIEERSMFESMLNNAQVRYKPPKRYDGIPAVVVDGEGSQPAVPAVWLQMARKFIAKQIDPLLFIPAVFSYIELGRRPPEPLQVVSDKYIERWPKMRAGQSETIRLALQMEQALARRELAIYKLLGKKDNITAHEIVLLDEGLALSPLFRYCLALAVGGKSMKQIAQRYVAEACLQYDRYREFYLCHWKGILPPKFKVRMQLIHDYLFAEAQAYAIPETDEENI
jgi:hypothetical protein